jgi:hypothetical protein
MGVQVIPGRPGAGDVLSNPTPGQSPSSPQTATAAANTAVTITLAASGTTTHVVTVLAYSYSASPTGGQITIKDGATTVFDLDVTSTWEVVASMPPGGIKGTAGAAMTVTLAAGGAGITGKLNIATLSY